MYLGGRAEEVPKVFIELHSELGNFMNFGGRKLLGKMFWEDFLGGIFLEE